MFQCGEIVNWYETFNDIFITKDEGIGMVLQIREWYGIKIYRVHRVKYNDIMSFEETHLEKIKKE